MTEADRLKDPAFLQLKTIQSERLSRTYADFMDQPIYEPTCRFFFGEVYTANDTSARDAAFAAFTAKLKRALGGDIVETLEMLVQLQALTVELDLLVFDAWQSMADQPTLTNDVYEKAYFRAGRHSDRVKQIDMLVEGLYKAFAIFHRFGIGSGLKALHRFQSFRGKTMVTGFLVRGYDAIHPLANIKPLAGAIDGRERKRLDRIWQENDTKP